MRNERDQGAMDGTTPKREIEFGGKNPLHASHKISALPQRQTQGTQSKKSNSNIRSMNPDKPENLSDTPKTRKPATRDRSSRQLYLREDQDQTL